MKTNNLWVGIGIIVLIFFSLIAIAGIYNNDSSNQSCPSCPAPIPCEEKTCPACPEPVISVDAFKLQVKDALLKEIEEDKNLRKCGGERYSAKDISISKIYPGVKILENSDGEVKVDDVKIRLAYYDSDEDKYCYKSRDFGIDSDGVLIKH